MNDSPATDTGSLERVLGHRFADATLLAHALRHASAVADAGSRLDSNERMEFLGDRVLGLAVADMLYQHFPNEEEGALARRLATLVSREALVRVAADIGLGAHVRLGVGEASAGGENPAILANAMEAVIGAIYLDGGFAAAARFVRGHWPALVAADLTPPKDAKTALQEWCQARGLPLPVYEEKARTGPAHAPVFTVAVRVATGAEEMADGASKREAERLAAERLLRALGRG